MTYIFDYIKELKLNKTITTKQLPFIENIFFYVEDLMIYKYIISVRPELLKRANRVGLKLMYDIHDNINVLIKEPLPNTSKGRFILMYDPGINNITITEGED